MWSLSLSNGLFALNELHSVSFEWHSMSCSFSMFLLSTISMDGGGDCPTSSVFSGLTFVVTSPPCRFVMSFSSDDIIFVNVCDVKFRISDSRRGGRIASKV